MAAKIFIPNDFEKSADNTKIEPVRVFIFRTNIGSDADKDLVVSELLKHLQVQQCTVDLDDCDRVLRVVAGFVKEDIINKVKQLGFAIEELD